MEADQNSVVKKLKEEAQKLEDLCQQKMKVSEMVFRQVWTLADQLLAYWDYIHLLIYQIFKTEW